MQTVDYLHFDFAAFEEKAVQKRKKGNPGSRSKARYKDIISAFDIETTTIPGMDQAIMYIWQWQFDDVTVIGRNWEEFTDFIRHLEVHMKENEWLMIFVHNLSFEFSFLKGIYPFKPEEVFAVESRKVLKCTMHNHFEFRCSYLHSNMSLAEYTAKMGVKDQKLSGDEFDYSKTRYPWTPLTDRELLYCINDVRGLVQAIRIDMENEKDNLYSFPLTATGYVRRDLKKALKKISHVFVSEQLPNYTVYKMCREAFRGGDTHANRYYAGKILENVSSADRSSSYPDIICNDKLPGGAFIYKGDATIDELLDLIGRREKAVLMRVSFWDIELSDPGWGCPYLSRDKCRFIENGVFDNGRILSASYLETTLTDVDIRILLDEYKWEEMKAFDVAYTKYAKLPQVVIDCVIKYYRDKTELKNVPGKEVYYTKQKNKLNSIYGCSAQDPVKQEILFINGDFETQNADEADLLTAYNRHAIMSYTWAPWITAWARYRLHEGIRLAGDGFVYCDTDSVKYLGDIDWTSYNNERIARSKESGAFASDPNGATHYMGVYEFEGVYDRFSTLGAKKYVTEENGKLSCTIAGVNKKKGGKELEKHGGIEAFKEGFIFTEAGGTESLYNDNVQMVAEIEGRKLIISDNVVIKPSTYTLGITAEYEHLLKNPDLLKRSGYI